MRYPVQASVLLAALAIFPAAAQPRVPRPTQVQPVSSAASSPAGQIVAVVNGDVISQADVENRGRLFALSTGLAITPEVLARLRPQITRQLIDERLRLQEEQRRKIIVSDKEIADAVNGIESRNGMQAGTLRRKLGDQGVALSTLYDQIRVQLGWTRVLRDELGDKTNISDADITEQQALLKAQTGQPEYRISEIFLPIEDPAKTADTQHFADAVIQQLRAGAPFPVVAAQFSQSQTALEGGDLGWIRTNQMDPQVAAVVTQMPQGAVSNPILVPGGISIISLRDKREVGHDMATVLSVRQVFLPFATPLNPAAPTEQQKKQLEAAQGVSRTVHSCDAMDAANKAAGSARPSDPGDVRLESVAPAMRAVLTALQPNQISRPLVSSDGIGLIMICDRTEKNMAEATKQEISERLLSDRVELVSRQLQRDLRRRALIDQRN
jgi:peptidyl-prolyl cis-trans isomerase SurA